MSSGKKVGIVGCTGAVGKEIINVLFDLSFPISELHLFASSRTAGSSMPTPYGVKTVQLFSVESVRQMDIVFLAVSGSFALQYVPEIIDNNGPIVIDNSSAFRYNPDVPLIIPEINGSDITTSTKLIANPNCTTAIAAMALYPIYCHYGIRKLIISTYQAASGAGEKGMDELYHSTKQMLDNEKVTNAVFPHPLAFNVIPHIDEFQENGYTKEEMKVAWETKKIFHDDTLEISCTAVRIPTLRAHAESITIETMQPINVEQVRQILSTSPGVEVRDDMENKMYPMPLTSSNKKDVYVGRLRQNIVYGDNGLDLFVCGDQLLRGAALNAVLIAKYIIDQNSVQHYNSQTTYPIAAIKKQALQKRQTAYLKQAGMAVLYGALVAGLTVLITKKRN